MNVTLKMALAVLCVTLGCESRHIQDPRAAVITKLEIDPWRPDGYKFQYETSYGSSRKESGYLKTAPDGTQFLVTQGMFSYIGPDQIVYRVNYIADEKGYHPSVMKSSSPPTQNNDGIFTLPSRQSNDIPEPDFPTALALEKDAPTDITDFAKTRLADPVLDEGDAEGVGNRLGFPPGLLASLAGG